jgi:hypothetical protein
VLRGLGLVYTVAFVSLLEQLLPLLGAGGLTPVAPWLERLAPALGARSRLEAFLGHPTLFWLDASDATLVATCALGAALAAVVLCGFANAPILAALWLLYLSFVQVGQLWYGFGWEMQLLETGFLAIFLCPLLDPRPFPRSPPPRIVVWLLRWLCFRVFLGAGLIKLRGDACWRDFTCLFSHYETQPVPGPLSWYFHHLPPLVHRLGVAMNHLAELVAPWLLLGPRRLRHAAAGLMALFQGILILSGNLSFLNWLTLVAVLACFDDALLARVLPARLVAAAARARAAARPPSRAAGATWLGLLALVAVLSLDPIANLLSSRQVMNTSFDRLHLVNTYGAFGSVGRHRDEIVIEGTSDARISDATEWREYEWKCKPGDPRRRPCLVTPYHYRLDWLIWFAAMSTPDRHPWVVTLVAKLLQNDPGALGLLAGNPFPEAPPRFVRAELYRYEFTDPGDPGGAWWRRRRLRLWLRPLALEELRLRERLTRPPHPG